MVTSNIIGGSNVFQINTEDPRWDAKFVSQLVEYERLSSVKERYALDKRVQPLSRKQMAITRIEKRCVYAKKDPCWGYIRGQGIKCRCIRGDCPHINKCNPDYKPEDTVYWTMTDEAKVSYGYPDKQKKYYLVDLVSDEEMLKYISDPKGAGNEFPTMKDLEPKSKKTENTKGRRLIKIGYEEIYFVDGDNQLSPILGYVEDVEDIGPLVKHRYGSRKEVVHAKAIKKDELKKDKKTAKTIVSNYTEKVKVEESKIETKPIIELPADRKAEYENYVKSRLSAEYQLTEITSSIIEQISEGKVLSIILANEAECAYVSSMLQQAEIFHDIEISGNAKVHLWKGNSNKIVIEGNALVSGEFVKQGCDLSKEKAWSELQKAGKIMRLIVTGRDFFSFCGLGEAQRWGCRNLYGATHIAVRVEDLILKEKISGEMKITLMIDSKNYIVLSTSSAEQLGITSEKLWKALESLKNSNEISGLPRVISGLILSETGNGVVVKGIGHMKFDEY